MQVDQAKLKAYLDGALTVEESAAVEKLLTDSAQAQATLAHLRQQEDQINQAFALLAPQAESQSPASRALRRFRTAVGQTGEFTPAANGASPQTPWAVVWESPTVWSELRTIFKNPTIKRGITMKFLVLMATTTMLIVVSAMALSNFGFGPGRQLSGVDGEKTNIQLPALVQEATPTATPLPPTPTNTPIPPTPTPALANVPFGYGIQADPLGDSEANIAHLKELGLGWVKFQMPWKAVEASQGNYNWETWDKAIEANAANDIKIMLHIVKAPDWARPKDDDKMVEGPPANPTTYAEFVTKVADRYQSKVQAIEVWNEQNLWYEAGGKGRINAAEYVKLLQLAYPAIKSVNKEIIVISGGLTPAGNVNDPDSGKSLAVDDIEYLKQMYEHGAKGYFDVLGAHPAGNNCPAMADWRTVTAEEAGAKVFLQPFQERHHSWCFLGTMEAYREVMVANGDGAKAITITEFGWAVSDTADANQGYAYARDNTPEDQAQWIVEAYQWGKQQGWVGPMFLWNLDFSVTYADTELTYFGIVSTPAYEALVKMPK